MTVASPLTLLHVRVSVLPDGNPSVGVQAIIPADGKEMISSGPTVQPTSVLSSSSDEAIARNACRQVATIHSGRLSYKSSNLRYKIERWRAHGRNHKGNEAIDPASLQTND
jgi:hypothetical protein